MPIVVNREQLSELAWTSEKIDSGDYYHHWSFTDGKHAVGASILRVPERYEYRMHKHLDWAYVAVLEGEIRLETPDGTVHWVEAGGSYYVPPGEAHIETMLANSVVVVLTGPKETYNRQLRPAPTYPDKSSKP